MADVVGAATGAANPYPVRPYCVVPPLMETQMLRNTLLAVPAFQHTPNVTRYPPAKETLKRPLAYPIVAPCAVTSVAGFQNPTNSVATDAVNAWENALETDANAPGALIAPNTPRRCDTDPAPPLVWYAFTWSV